MTKDELLTKKISAISLGCDKNKVDLENMLGRLRAYGFDIVAQPEDADIVIVNTCSFIQPAKEEGISNILDMAALKKKGVIEKIIVTGCMPQRYMAELNANFPEIDRALPLKENENICQVIEGLYGVKLSKKSDRFERVLTNLPSYCYLKISDGCNNACSYCAIPRIRGRYRSTPIDQLVDEAKNLVERGCKEIVLVAQDTTRYGEDLYGKNMLIDLCKRLCKIKGLRYIRLHYTYPEMVDKNLLDYIASEPKMCKYIDIPLQHIDDKILVSMRRRLDESSTRELVNLLAEYPQIKVRSTFIVGYPGEKRAQFQKLIRFLKDAKFDYVGFFPYYREEGTASFYMSEQISQFVKNLRLKKAKKVQNQIYQAKASALIGQTFDVLVDDFDQIRGLFVGHTEFLSPTVDFDVRFVDNGNVKISDIVKVKFLQFDGKSFIGEVV